MADNSGVVVCEPLCFVINRYGKATSSQLIEILSSFYDVDKLSSAKKQLCDDIEEMKLDKWPRPSRRRESGNRARIEADDIVSLFSFLDEKLVMNKLPKYVCSDIDRIPTTKWFDGDLQILLSKINKLEHESSDLKDTLRRIETIVSKQCSDFIKQMNVSFENQQMNIIASTDLHNNKLSAMKEVIGSIDRNFHDFVCRNLYTAPGVNAGEDQLCDKQVEANVQITAACRPTDMDLGQTDQIQQHQAWSGHANLPPAVRGLRQLRATIRHQSITDSVTADSDNDGGQVFTEILSRRGKKRKNNSGIALDGQLNNNAKNQTSRDSTVNFVKVIGKMQAGQSCKIKASGKIIDKLVFCVSNISDEYNCDDMQSFFIR
jgi:hypothetical protein